MLTRNKDITTAEPFALVHKTKAEDSGARWIGLLRWASWQIWLADVCLNEIFEYLFLGQDSADQDKYYRLGKGIALVWLIKIYFTFISVRLVIIFPCKLPSWHKHKAHSMHFKVFCVHLNPEKGFIVNVRITIYIYPNKLIKACTSYLQPY